jgi:hypothetical protein
MIINGFIVGLATENSFTFMVAFVRFARRFSSAFTKISG